MLFGNIQSLHVSGSVPGSRAMDDCLLDATPCDFYFLYFEAMSTCLMTFCPLRVPGCVVSYGGVDNHSPFYASLYTL